MDMIILLKLMNYYGTELIFNKKCLAKKNNKLYRAKKYSYLYSYMSDFYKHFFFRRIGNIVYE